MSLMQQLPNEILERILFPLRWRDRYACLTVCRSWHAAAITSLYTSLPLAALTSGPKSLASCYKYAHLIKEFHWTAPQQNDSSLNEAKKFLLLPEHYSRVYIPPSTSDQTLPLELLPEAPPSLTATSTTSPQDIDDMDPVDRNQDGRGTRPRLLTLKITTFASGEIDEAFFTSLIASHPTLTALRISAAGFVNLLLPIEEVMRNLPRLKHLEIDQLRCRPLIPSLWLIQDVEEGNNANDTDTIVGTNTSTDTNINVNSESGDGHSVFGNQPSPHTARPPYGLQHLSYPEVFDEVKDYGLFFRALPELVSLDINVMTLPNIWSNITELFFPFNIGPMPWYDTMAHKFCESLLRYCPKLKLLNITGRGCKVQLDIAHYKPGVGLHNRDGKTPLDKTLPLILKALYQSRYRNSREDLHWLLDTCGSGVVAMNISYPVPNGAWEPPPPPEEPVLTPTVAPAVADGALDGAEPIVPAATTINVAGQSQNTITSQDLQRILESCPRLQILQARGQHLAVKDIASLSLPSHSTSDDNNNSVDAAVDQGDRSKRSSTARTMARPWACSRTLKRLVIGINADTDDYLEHQTAWAQLGKMIALDALELYETNLVPKLSHGFGAMNELSSLYAFTIERWTYPQRSCSSDGQERAEDQGHATEGDLVQERQAEPPQMMDAEAVAMMATNWIKLGALRLDLGQYKELMDEMHTMVKSEKDRGRMRTTELSMIRV
ncbi:hypothetical protein BGZ99_005413 [Dissophora globulifera]|uniref:F-box domain-containing protein n=1 Tax=Dissophora globulifera TaxID=979702 RepID=A0A9P6UYU8_9FUNG|nr:hypothetical protein BGZ99_005413 [Dissophora globulifera]